MKKSLLFLASITLSLSSFGQVKFMNAVSASVTATYSISVSQSIATIELIANAAFNGTTTKDSLYGSIDGGTTWTFIRTMNPTSGGSDVVALLNPSNYGWYKVRHVAGDASAGTITGYYLQKSGPTASWNTPGNILTGTLPASPTEWLGTYNAADLVVKTNNTEAGRITSEGISSWKIPQASYGNTVTVTFTSTTEAKAVKFPVTIDTIGFYSVGDSLFYARYAGWYELIFNAPCDMSAGSGGAIDTWLNINGSIVANSRHSVIVNSTLQLEFINTHKFYLSAGQYFKISSRADDTRCRFVYSAEAASPTRPARPSAEFIITKISK